MPSATELKVFVPAMTFSESLEFYTALGWSCKWQEGGLAELELANSRFYLQNHYNKAWANNFMMHITVDDASAWWRHASNVISGGTYKYKYARLETPREEAYGALVTYVWDPSGVLLHFAQPLNSSRA